MLSDLSPVLGAAMRQVVEGSAELSLAGEAGSAELDLEHADALLLGTETPFAGAGVVGLLDEHPRLKIVCITPDGRHAVLHERRLDSIEVTDVSFATIFATLRTACAAEVL